MESLTKQRNEQIPAKTDVGQVPKKSKGLRGTLLVLTAFIACPCHLPITLALIGGTTFGLFLTENLLWIVPILGVYFVWALYKGLKIIS